MTHTHPNCTVFGKVTGLLPDSLLQCSNATLPSCYPPPPCPASPTHVSPFALPLPPYSPCLSLSGLWKESIKLPVQHLQHASFSFLRLLQLWGDPGPSWGIVVGAHGLKERARGFEFWQMPFLSKTKAPHRASPLSSTFIPFRSKGCSAYERRRPF